MKGKNYLIITSILIIAGSLAGFMTDIFSSMFPGNWHVSSLVSAVICLLFLITGIMGLACRKIYSLICVILGIILCIFSILSIPLMFWAGDGSAPLEMILLGFVYFIIFGMYLRGIYLNRKVPRKESYCLPADFIPLHHNS